ncbi:MAG: D-alanyl-D-alanine carboxypeptidase/D-alanyl-D-alanine-endopeptidase [Micromonosporaceae bacterium]
MARGWPRRRTWLAAVGLPVAVAVAAVAVVRPFGADPAPELSIRRLPAPPAPVLAAVDADAPLPDAGEVAAAVDGVLARSTADLVAAMVVDAATGTVLYERDADVPAVPASATKLATAAAVLATLGPSHRIPTVAVAGSRAGEVVLVGGGDPTLAVDETAAYPQAARLEELAAQVRRSLGGAPVTRVTVDSSLFAGDVYGPWDADVPTGGYAGPVTALMTDGGRVDPDAGTPAERFPEPDLAAGRAFARLLGVDPDDVARGRAPTPPAAPSPGPPAATSPPGTPPPTAAPATGGPAPGTELGRVVSPPLLRLVEIMLVTSDNVLAEALARLVAAARGQPVTFQGAGEAVIGTLADLGLRVDGSRLADGSGLSRRNRLSATLLTDLLTTALARPDLAGVVSGLPVAGWSGTLADRYRSPQPRTAAGAGVVRAKTGTLSGVSALAGVLVTADGRLLVFALLANGGPDGTADLLDEVAATLAGCGCSG